jgi:hypothetical protein
MFTVNNVLSLRDRVAAVSRKEKSHQGFPLGRKTQKINPRIPSGMRPN